MAVRRVGVRWLEALPLGATLNRNGGYHGTKADLHPMDGLVVNGTRRLEQRVAVHWFSGSAGSMDQPPAFADWLCSCSLRPVAGVWAIDGL